MGREPTAERRIEILETAVSLFLSQGYLRTSMQDVAETASVSKATLYQIFESKEGLGTEAVSLLTMRMLERVEAAAERNHPFSQDLLKWRKVRRGLSAGRVQSAALKIICDRENEIKAFVPQEYWTITAALS